MTSKEIERQQLKELLRKEQDDKNDKLNLGVKSRQVERAKMFRRELAEVTEKFGGDPRKNRRKIARARVRNIWRARKAAA